MCKSETVQLGRRKRKINGSEPSFNRLRAQSPASIRTARRAAAVLSPWLRLTNRPTGAKSRNLHGNVRIGCRSAVPGIPTYWS
jgi:hypothetical protein